MLMYFLIPMVCFKRKKPYHQTNDLNAEDIFASKGRHGGVPHTYLPWKQMLFVSCGIKDRKIGMLQNSHDIIRLSMGYFLASLPSQQGKSQLQSRMWGCCVYGRGLHACRELALKLTFSQWVQQKGGREGSSPPPGVVVALKGLRMKGESAVI